MLIDCDEDETDDGSNNDVNSGDSGGQSKADCGNNIDDNSEDSNDNGGVDTNGKNYVDFGYGEIKVDCGDKSDGGGDSGIIDDGGANDDVVADINSSNNPDYADGKSKVVIGEGIASDDGNGELFCGMVDPQKAISFISS